MNDTLTQCNVYRLEVMENSARVIRNVVHRNMQVRNNLFFYRSIHVWITDQSMYNIFIKPTLQVLIELNLWIVPIFSHIYLFAYLQLPTTLHIYQ